MDLTISIVGYGRVGRFLTNQLESEAKIVQIYNRSPLGFDMNPNIEVVTELNQLKPSDIYFLTVSDDSIAFVAQELYQNPATRKSLVVHCSGSSDLDVLMPYRRKGYSWPLQSISDDVEIDVLSTPFYVGGSYGEDATLLQDLFSRISHKVRISSLDQKRAMHLSATIANNFSNLMYVLAKNICDRKELIFEDLYPIIQETVLKLKELSPEEAQTGPAIRGDISTIETHLQIIRDIRPDLESWYIENSKLINPDLDL